MESAPFLTHRIPQFYHECWLQITDRANSGAQLDGGLKTMTTRLRHKTLWWSIVGTVAKGMVADLVLIDSDPLADIRNTRRISAVVSNGRYLDRPALDAMLANAERLARSGEHDLIHRPGPGKR